MILYVADKTSLVMGSLSITHTGWTAGPDAFSNRSQLDVPVRQSGRMAKAWITNDYGVVGVQIALDGERDMSEGTLCIFAPGQLTITMIPAE